MPKTKSNRKVLIGVGALITTLFLVYFLAFSPYSPFLGRDGTVATPTTKTASTITLLDYASGEDVSAWVEVSVWLPEDDDTEFDTESDPYRISNFDEDIDSRHADDISVDLRPHAYAWLEIDPDDQTVFMGEDAIAGGIISDDWRPLIGGANYDYIFYVYHVPENVSLVMLGREANTGGNVTWTAGVLVPGTSDPFSPWNGYTDANLTIILDVPNNDASELHAGETGDHDWDISNEDLDEILENEDELAWLTDQRNWRTIAPLYDINDDLEKEYEDRFTQITNAFVIRIRFNSTISEIDGNANEVNATLNERDFNEYDIEVIYSNDSIYCVFMEPVTFDADIISFDIEIQMGVDINATRYQLDALTTAMSFMGGYTGRLSLPYDQSPIGTFTALSRAPRQEIY